MNINTIGSTKPLWFLLFSFVLLDIHTYYRYKNNNNNNNKKLVCYTNETFKTIASPQIDPMLVGIPYLNQDALDLLSNCCTSKESDMWQSLGPNWTQTIDINLLKMSRLPSSFQPVFSDGWAPVIGELELIGLVLPPVVNQHNHKQITLSTTSSCPTSAATSTTSPNNRNKYNHKSKQQQPIGGNRGQSDVINQKPMMPELNERSMITKSSNFIKSRSQHHLDGGNNSDNNLYPNDNCRKRNGSTNQLHNSIGQLANRSEFNQQKPVNILHESDDRDVDNGNYRAYQHRDNFVDDNLVRADKLSMSPRQRYEHQASDQMNMLNREHHNNHYNRSFESFDEYQSTMLDQAYRNEPQYLDNMNNSADYDNQDAIMMPVNKILGSSYNDYPVRSRMSTHSIDNHGQLKQQTNGFRLEKQHTNRIEHQHMQASNITPRQSGDVLLSPAYLVRRYTQASLPQQDTNKLLQRSQIVDKRRSMGVNGELARASTTGDLYADQIDLNANGAYLDEADQEIMLLDLGPAQTEWFFELQSRGSMIVRVLFTREANNDKELTVRR